MKMDGKNREEQENGAKVRDLEEYKAENRKRKRRRRITVGILAGAILAAGIGTGVWLQLRTFQGYDTGNRDRGHRYVYVSEIRK